MTDKSEPKTETVVFENKFQIGNRGRAVFTSAGRVEFGHSVEIPKDEADRLNKDLKARMSEVNKITK